LQSGWVLNDNGSLKYSIDKKEEESKKYRTNNYFQKWLVIYAGGTGLHDMYIDFNIDSTRQGAVSLIDTSNKTSHSFSQLKSDYFTHIFLWDKFSETIYQLFPYQKKIFDFGEKAIYVNHLPLK